MALPPFPQFCVKEDPTTVGVRWKRYKARLDNLLAALDIQDIVRQKAILLHYGGEELNDLVETFADDNKTDYTVLCTSLDTYFQPSTNHTFETFKLRKLKQEPSETVDQFHVRVRKQAQLCNFADIERETLAQLIEGVKSNRLRKKGLKNTLSLSQFLAEARSDETIQRQSDAIESAQTSEKCNKVYQNNSGHRSNYNRGNSRGANRGRGGGRGTFNNKHFQTSQKHFSHNSSGSSSSSRSGPGPDKQKTTQRCHNCNREWPHMGGSKELSGLW